MDTDSSDTTLPKELWQAFRGAVSDIEEFVASERAFRLQTLIGWTDSGANLLAWFWFAALALHLAITPVVLTEAVPLATAEIGHRDAVFIVLGVVLIGPMFLLALYWVLSFLHRVFTDILSRRLPRAFRPLASNLVVLASLVIAWVLRGDLNRIVWAVSREIQHAFAVAAEFSPIV